MLQQTTVAAVIPYFERWLHRFPTVAALAIADEQEVLKLWQGLGYYSRARNLLKAARAVVESHGGIVPSDLDALRSLPGVGEYTACAVAAFSFDKVAPVVDANIARVLARLFDWRQPIDDKAGRQFLQEASFSLQPALNGRLHNSAIMELGALICTSRNPKCVICPVRAECLAEQPELLPIKRPRPKIEHHVERRAFEFRKGKIWLIPSHGPRWKGMWLLPDAESHHVEPDHVEIYPITRYRVTMEVFSGLRKKEGLSGFSPENLPPMPSPHRRAVAAMLSSGHSRAS